MFQKAFKTIIVGVDFSDYSKIAVKQAQQLCQLWKTELVLVHAIHDVVVYSPSLYISFPNVVSEKTYEERIQKFYKIKNNSTKFIARRGSPTNLLIEIAAQYENSLILVGHQGHNKIETFFFGSTAQSLILQSKTPVWVHRGHQVIKPRKVLIPHDLSRASNHSIDIIQKLKLDVPDNYTVLHVQQKAFPVLDYQTYQYISKSIAKNMNRKIKNILQHYPKIHIEKADGDVTENIVKKTKSFDLLVMAHHNPTGLFSKSETVELMKRVKTPILITH